MKTNLIYISFILLMTGQPTEVCCQGKEDDLSRTIGLRLFPSVENLFNDDPVGAEGVLLLRTQDEKYRVGAA